MKITNISKAPTLVYPLGRPGGVMVEPGASYEGDFEYGQAVSHQSDTERFKIEGKLPPKPADGATDGRKTDHKQADVQVAADRDAAVARAEKAEGDLETVTAERDALAAQLADLGEQDVTEDNADDLRKQAIGLGIKVDKRWTDETVQRKIDEKLAE